MWLRLLAIAFVLHLGWEMAQMGAYQGMDFPWRETLGRCALAASFDAVVTLVIVAPFLRRRGFRRSWAGIAVAGLVAGLAIEAVGLRLGRWAYGQDMPVWPVIGLGVLPTVQMAVLPVLSAWLAIRRWARRTASPSDDRR